jgi:TatA/E family protein of Tat protein translocase
VGFDNPIHIAFLLILLLLVFGAKRLPEMGRSLGAGMREQIMISERRAHPGGTTNTRATAVSSSHSNPG